MQTSQVLCFHPFSVEMGKGVVQPWQQAWWGCLLLNLEQEEPQVDVLGGQQLVAPYGVNDGQRHVVRLVALVGEHEGG